MAEAVRNNALATAVALLIGLIGAVVGSLDGVWRADDTHPLPHARPRCGLTDPYARRSVLMGLILLWLLGVPGIIILVLFMLGIGH